MNIGINALSASIGASSVYLHHLIRSLVERKDENSYFVFCAQKNVSRLNLPYTSHNLEVVEVSIASLIHRLYYEQIHFPQLVNQHNIDVLYAPAEIAPLRYRNPIVLATQNPNPYVSKPVGRTVKGLLRLRALRFMGQISAQRACQVVFVSEWACSFVAPVLHVPPCKQNVVYHGVDVSLMEEVSLNKSAAAQKVKDLAGNRDIVLAVSSLAPHKNYDTLLKSIALLPKDVKSGVLLVIVGNTQGKVYHELQLLSSKLNIESNITFVGEVAHGALGLFYRMAKVFVQPAKEETFGMTLLEAMAFEVPVICSTAGPFPEIASNAVLYFDFDDAQRIADLITEIILNPDSASSRVALGKKRSQEFTWERTAEQMVHIFEKCYKDSTK